jgi:hypothetical protein
MGYAGDAADVWTKQNGVGFLINRAVLLYGMGGRLDRLDGFLGRLVFRLFGAVCAIVALICGYAVWWHVSRGVPNSWVPPILFGIAAIAAASCVPYCFSRSRTFDEALDAMEGGAGDTNRWASRNERRSGRRL